MKKTLALLSLICACGFVTAQEIPAPNAPDTARQNKAVKVKKNRPQNRVMNNRLTKLQKDAADILAKFDTNKNGKLDASEKKIMDETFADAKDMFMLSLAYKSIQAIDEDNNLIFSEKELENAPEKLREMHARRKQQRDERIRKQKEERIKKQKEERNKKQQKKVDELLNRNQQK